MTPQEIKYMRTFLARTQKNMATVVGVSANTWARWERGETTPYPRHLDRLNKLKKYVGTQQKRRRESE